MALEQGGDVPYDYICNRVSRWYHIPFEALRSMRHEEVIRMWEYEQLSRNAEAKARLF